jgi:hypothetical protein
MTYDQILRKISPESLRDYGVKQIAYVKDAGVDGEPVFEVHAASGEELARFADKEIAFAVCQQNQLEPLSVH